MLRLSRTFFKSSKGPALGRWSREFPERKIDLANHDHCGGPVCSNTKLTKMKHLPDDSYDNTMELAICALQSFHLSPSKSK